MKSFLYCIAVLSVAVIIFLFSGCNGQAKLQDGEYTVRMKEAEHGWVDYLTITVSDGRIITVDYDGLDEKGNRKSEDEAYRTAMEPVAGTYPADFCPKLEKMLIGETDTSGIEKVTGATTSSNNFKRLAEKVLELARTGDTSEQTVSGN